VEGSTDNVETAAAPSDAELRALIDFAPDGIFVVGTDGRLAFANPATCRLLGCNSDELLGVPVADLLPAEDAERIHAAHGNLPYGSCHVSDSTLRRKDGSLLSVEISTAQLPDGRWQGWVRDRTERALRDHVREEALRQSEADRQWLTTVIETVPLGVLLFRPGGRLTFNRRAEELLGMSLSTDGGTRQYSSRIFHPDGRQVEPDELVSTRVLQRGETVIAEQYLVQHKNGTRTPILGSAAPLRDAAGNLVGGIGVFQDISEPLRLGDALRANERLLQEVFDILPVGVWIADRNGHLVRHNAAGERIWGGALHVPIAEFDRYKGWYVDTGKPIAAEDWAMARALVRGETTTRELVRIQSFDGSFKTIIHSAVPLRDLNGDISGAIAVNEDITALHEAQERQRASERLLRTVIDLLPVGVWVADEHGQITLANPAGAHIWEGTRYVGPDQYAEYQGWSVDNGQPIAADQWGLARALRLGESSRAELIRIRAFDGSFKTIINWAAPIRSDTGEILGAVAVNEDVTSFQRTQEQLRAAVREREEILAVVAHDLRNPLQAILNYLRALERHVHDSQAEGVLRTFLTAAEDIVGRMVGLVDDLLTVSVASTGGGSLLKLAPIPAATLLARAAAAARPLVAHAGLELDLELRGDLPVINVDADKLLRVIGNLLDNALKFTEAAGRITLAAEATTGGVRFSVANTGVALTDAERAAMFQPFWQGRRDRRGAGLGLSICRSIVEAHGGTIWAEPVEGMRVRVCVVLPRQPATDAAPL
jgi:PAS domain S-box-containing protein